MAGSHNSMGSSPPSGGAVCAIFLAVVMLVLLWLRGKTVILWLTYGPDFAQYWALDSAGHLRDEKGIRFFEWVRACLQGDVALATIKVSDITMVMSDVGARTWWIMTALLALMAVISVFKVKGDGLRRVYSLTGQEKKKILRVAGVRVKSKILGSMFKFLATVTLSKKKLIEEKEEWSGSGLSFFDYQSKYWKISTPGAQFNPDDAVFDFQAFIKGYGWPTPENITASLSPAFAKFNMQKDFPARAPQLSPTEWMIINCIGFVDDEYDDQKMWDTLSVQLGPVWTGLATAPVHAKAICVLAALNVKRDHTINKLKNDLAVAFSFNQGKKQEDEVMKLLEPFLSNKAIVRAILRKTAGHAYLMTAMIAVFGWGGPMKEWGGGASVLATSMIQWLKGIDRTMFYCLNCVGRRSFHVEAIGAINHFFAERITGNRIEEPFVENAIEGIKKYFKNQGMSEIRSFYEKEDIFQE